MEMCVAFVYPSGYKYARFKDMFKWEVIVKEKALKHV